VFCQCRVQCGLWTVLHCIGCVLISALDPALENSVVTSVVNKLIKLIYGALSRQDDTHWYSIYDLFLCRARGSVQQSASWLKPIDSEAKIFSFDRREFNLHYLYANDKQFYMHTKPGLASTRLTSLAACFSDLSNWCTCASRRLQLNAAKTDLIWFGSRSTLRRLTGDNNSLSNGSLVVKSVETVRDFGVLLDSELTMKQHISHVVSIGYYHLRRLRQLRRHITQDAMKQLVCSLILSRIDYCNSVLIGLPVSSIVPLQRLQNAAARLAMGLRAHHHVSYALASLHWLLIRYRIQYKVALGNIVTPLHNRPSP